MLSETGPSTSSAEQSRTDDVDTAALKLLGEGKRHLLVGDAPTAVTTLQEACEILAAKYGEVSDQCGDSYYHYGNALLELGRMESGVLGNALDGVPEGAATDTDDADDEADNKANVERASKLPDVGAGTTDMGEVAAGGASATDEDGDSSEDDDTGNDTADENKEENPDDIPNFQLAWEMLELSRLIFSRKTDKESKLKVAQVHFKLGELGLETENYAQSLEDFVKCLEIQKEHLEPESRLIAGSHYNLGLAYTFDSKMEKALEHFKHAKQTIEERVKKLEKDVTEHEEKKEEKYEETVTKLKDEIKELNELIPDILAKIEDAKDAKNQQPFGETSSGFGQSSSGASSSSAAPMQIQVKRKTDNATVTDISHLVKRKRTDESSDSHSASAAGDATEAKRTKQDEANSTSGDSNQVNGGPDASTTKDEKAMAMET